MKWFKHHSNSHRDSTLKGIFRKYGLEGEARFWRLIELMAEQFQNDDVQFEFDLETIRESLRFRSVNDCRPFLDLLTTLTQMKIEYSGNNCRIIYRKILEIKDNHARNLQVADKSLTSNLLLEENKKKKEKKNKKEDILVDLSTDYTRPLEIPCEDAPTSHEPSFADKCNTVAEIWNDIGSQLGLVKVRTPLSKDRMNSMRVAITEFSSPQDWVRITQAIEGDDFLMGKNDRGWKASFDWLFHKTKFNYRKLWESHDSIKWGNDE